MKKTLVLAIITGALFTAAQARADLYDIAYVGADSSGNVTTASGWLDVTGGVADGGLLTVVGAVNAGTYTLVLGQDLNVNDTFTYDNLVSPGSAQFLNNVNQAGGLLWSTTGAASGTEINLWYNTPAEAATLAPFPQYYDVANAFGLWGYDGSYEPQTYGSATLTPVPEPTTVLSAALLLLPFGASTVRVLRRSRAA